jgi:hypothetical protein
MKVQFIKNISDLKISNVKPKTLLIYHELYENELPQIQADYMPFQKFKNIYSELEYDMFIIIGLNRMITPSNRCQMVNDYLQTMTQNIEKISIDNSPFIGEPWRVWYHYDVCNCNTFNIPHGYAMETEWKHWFYRNRNDCRLSGDNISLFIQNTYSDLDFFNTKFEFYDISDTELKHYEELKEIVFDKYNSPKLWINNLLKLCNQHFGLKLSFDSYRGVSVGLFGNNVYSVPDIGIYRFIVEENIRRMEIYNAVVKSGHNENI